MLKYTGHPLVDVGIATITAFAGKSNPGELTQDDLQLLANYVEGAYSKPPLKGFLHGSVFMNSGFTQPAFDNAPEKRTKYANRVLRSFLDDAVKGDEKCVFSGEQAIGVPLDVRDELPPGRLFRQHMPLLTGERVINFHPYGDTGLAVSGPILLAIQAIPLGCAKCEGRLLAVSSDNISILQHFARTFLAENRRAILLAQTTGVEKMPEYSLRFRTLLIKTLVEAVTRQEDAIADEEYFSVTAYHVSNSGQDPKLDIYYLPSQAIRFIRDMQRAEYRPDWQAIVERAWQIAPPTKKGGKKPTGDFLPRRNYLYEDIFDLPNNARAFLRTYFLRVAWRYARAELGDPRGSYSLQDEASLVSWKITARFLKRIMNMEKDRIEEIRKMGDGLAEYISSQNDRFLFANFRDQNYHRFRTTILRANLAQVRSGQAPVIRFDPYIEVFEIAENDARPDWRLARDLVLIRMIERLHELGWLKANIDATPEVADEDAEVAS